MAGPRDVLTHPNGNIRSDWLAFTIGDSPRDLPQLWFTRESGMEVATFLVCSGAQKRRSRKSPQPLLQNRRPLCNKRCQVQRKQAIHQQRETAIFRIEVRDVGKRKLDVDIWLFTRLAVQKCKSMPRKLDQYSCKGWQHIVVELDFVAAIRGHALACHEL